MAVESRRLYETSQNLAAKRVSKEVCYWWLPAKSAIPRHIPLPGLSCLPFATQCGLIMHRFVPGRNP